jgi:hypothetical protein
MPPVLRINDRDLSTYVRMQHGEGFDPANGEYSDPQFSGSPAFTEGAAFTSDAVGNRELTVPLILDASGGSSLRQLIGDINNELKSGSTVAFATDSADDLTYFDLERGRLDVEYQFFLVRANAVRAVLHLWTRPYGNTGTARLVASIISGTAAMQLSATGIIGDVDALANIEVRVGSQVASGGRVVAYGVHSSASFNGIRGPSAPDFVAQSGATVRAYPTSLGSNALALPVSPTAASGVALTSYLTPPAGHTGRHRVLALARTRLDQPIAVYARDKDGARLGPTVLASVTDPSKWGLLDLGEVSVPYRDARQEAVPTQYVEVIAGGASGAAIVASPAFEVNRMIYLPLDKSAGILRTKGAAGNTALYFDGFYRGLSADAGLDQYTTIETGNANWRKTSGGMALSIYGLIYPTDWMVMPIIPRVNATGFYSLASGAQNSDVSVESVLLMNATYAAGPTSFAEVWPKQLNASYGFAARFIPGPSQCLQLMSYSAAGVSVMASCGIPTTLASGIYQAQRHKMVVETRGGNMNVWLATAPAGSPALSASHSEISGRGWPAVKMGCCSNVASGLLFLDSINVQSLSGSASDIGSRETFRFESYPENRTIQGNASIFIADRTANFRGNKPRIPAGGSPGASGAPQMVVLSGAIDNIAGNDVTDVTVRVVDQFKFLR